MQQQHEQGALSDEGEGVVQAADSGVVCRGMRADAACCLQRAAPATPLVAPILLHTRETQQVTVNQSYHYPPHCHLCCVWQAPRLWFFCLVNLISSCR
jgi:hypothetical protein